MLPTDSLTLYLREIARYPVLTPDEERSLLLALAKGEVWSLFFVGVRVRDWGFINADGRWVQWQEYLGSKQDA